MHSPSPPRQQPPHLLPSMLPPVVVTVHPPTSTPVSSIAHHSARIVSLRDRYLLSESNAGRHELIVAKEVAGNRSVEKRAAAGRGARRRLNGPVCRYWAVSKMPRSDRNVLQRNEEHPEKSGRKR
jgi:hypothetical protein